MKVLVTGATGFVGREVVKRLHEAGYDVHFLSRRGRSPGGAYLEWILDSQIHVGNVLDPPSLPSAMKGMDAVVHLVGIISEVGEQTFENVHTRATQNVVAAAREASVRRFIHMSALGTRPNAEARYHQTKWAAERAVRECGMDWTIFRPSIIYGCGDGFVNLFARMSRFSPVMPLIGGGKTKFQPLPVEQVAQCFVKSLTEPASIGQVYDLCGSETLTLAEIVDAILAVTRRRRLKLPIPFAVASAQAAFLEFYFGKLRHEAPPLNRDQLLMLRENNEGDGRPAAELFNLKPIGFRDGVARFLSPRAGGAT